MMPSLPHCAELLRKHAPRRFYGSHNPLRSHRDGVCPHIGARTIGFRTHAVAQADDVGSGMNFAYSLAEVGNVDPTTTAPPSTENSIETMSSAASMATATSDATSVVSGSTGPAPDDPVIAVLFGIATVALAIVTLGVAYLSFESWRASQQESQDRLRSERQTSVGVGSSASDNEEKGKRKKGPPASASSKGFGSKRTR